MKIKKLIFLLILALSVFSCKDDTDGGFTQVKPIENQIYRLIKDYRIDEGLTGPFVKQYLIVKEAQLYSYRMASGLEEVGIQGINEHYATLSEKYSFYNYNTLVLKTDASNENQIFNELLQIPGADSTLLGDLTQCGVGVESDTDGFNYVTVILAKADS